MSFIGIGQKKLVLKINSKIEFTYKNTFFSPEKRQQEIEKYKFKLIAEGYISTYYDFIFKTDSLHEIQFVIGKKYEWNLVLEDEKVQQMLGKKTLPKTITGKIIQEKALQILKYCENNGYPFATVNLSEVRIKKNKVNAKLNVQFNDYYTIDSIEIKGDAKTSRNFILKTIEINKGNGYKEYLIQKISSKINSVPFLENIKSPEVYFTKGKATLVLYIKNKNASKFNGILGLNSNKTTGKHELVGDLNIDLRNIFKAGERLILEWEKVKNNSQKYLISYNHPYLFRTRIGTEMRLNYYRQDSSFDNLDAKIRVNYRFNSYSKISLIGQNIQSNSLLNLNSNPNFPAINTSKTVYYGVGLDYHKLDYEFNPRKGWAWNLEFLTGNKTITKDISNLDVDYQNINNKTKQQKLKLEASLFLPLFKKSVVLFKLQSANIFSNQLFDNELIQIGGLKTIRGFNEQSILASNFYTFTTEYRYLFSENSSVFTFLDYGYYENKSNNEFIHDTPFGFGIGVNFATKSGVFTLNYALGKQQNNPILIKNGKIHFGFVSLF